MVLLHLMDLRSFHNTVGVHCLGSRLCVCERGPVTYVLTSRRFNEGTVTFDLPKLSDDEYSQRSSPN